MIPGCLKSFGALIFVLTSVFAAVLISFFDVRAGELAIAEDPSVRAAEGKSESAEPTDDLGYEDLQWRTNNLIEDVFEVVRLKPVRKNLSMGVTPQGLNLQIDW